MILNNVQRLPFKSKVDRTVVPPGEWVPKWRHDRGYVLKYSKSSAPSSTCILFAHGGGFTKDQPRSPSYDSFGYILSYRTGYDTYIPDYTLAPDKQYPSQIHELLEIARRLSKDYRRVIIGGDSAGGTMAIQMCLIEPQLFYSAFVVSAWIDLECNGPSYYSRAWNEKVKAGDPVFKDPPKKEIKDSREEALLYLGKKSLFKDPVANPIHATQDMLRHLPPFLFLIGDSEIIRDGTLELAARAQEVNPNIFAFLYEGMWHDWVLYSQKSSGEHGDHGINTIAAFCTSGTRGATYNFVPPSDDKGPLTLACNIVI